MHIRKQIVKGLKSIEEYINRSVRSLRPLTFREYDEIPKPLTKQNYIVIKDAVVGIEGGLYPQTLFPIIKECRRYEGKTFLRRRDTGQKGSFDDLLELLILESTTGTLLDILVEKEKYRGLNSDTPTAEEIALKIYSGITTRGKMPDTGRLKR